MLNSSNKGIIALKQRKCL